MPRKSTVSNSAAADTSATQLLTSEDMEGAAVGAATAAEEGGRGGDASTLSATGTKKQQQQQKANGKAGRGKDKDEDREEPEGVAVDDLLLPRTLTSRLARGVLPANTSIQKDALLALTKAATVFVSYLAHNANELTAKKTVAPQDVLKAIREIEMDGVMGLGAVHEGHDGRVGGRLERELEVFESVARGKRKGYRDKLKARDSGVGEHDTAAGGSARAGDDQGEEANGERETKRPRVEGDDGGRKPGAASRRVSSTTTTTPITPRTQARRRQAQGQQQQQHLNTPLVTNERSSHNKQPSADEESQHTNQIEEDDEEEDVEEEEDDDDDDDDEGQDENDAEDEDENENDDDDDDDGEEQEQDEGEEEDEELKHANDDDDDAEIAELEGRSYGPDDRPRRNADAILNGDGDGDEEDESD